MDTPNHYLYLPTYLTNLLGLTNPNPGELEGNDFNNLGRQVVLLQPEEESMVKSKIQTQNVSQDWFSARV